MDPFVLWLTVALAGMGTFAGWLVKWIIAHLESDLAYTRRSADRGAGLAEKGATAAEQKAG